MANNNLNITIIYFCIYDKSDKNLFYTIKQHGLIFNQILQKYELRVSQNIISSPQIEPLRIHLTNEGYKRFDTVEANPEIIETWFL